MNKTTQTTQTTQTSKPLDPLDPIVIRKKRVPSARFLAVARKLNRDRRYNKTITQLAKFCEKLKNIPHSKRVKLIDSFLELKHALGDAIKSQDEFETNRVNLTTVLVQNKIKKSLLEKVIK